MRTLRLFVTLLYLIISLSLIAGAQTGTYTFTELGVLNPARPYIKLGSINNAGQIAGASLYPDGNIRAFLITPSSVAGQQVWYTDANNDGVNDLMAVLPLGSKYHWSVGRSVNNSGQVTGTSQGSSTTLPESATVWGAGGSFTTLTQGQNTSKSEGFSINDSGSVAGVNYASNTGTIWRLVRGSYQATALGTLGFSSSQGVSVNNLDQVTGSLWSPGANGSFLWLPAAAYGLKQGMNQFVGFTPNFFFRDSYNFPRNINNAGIIVGSGPIAGHVYLWVPPGAGAAYGLADGVNDIQDTAWMSATGLSLNNPAPGQPLRVVGTAQDASGQNHAFVWDSTSRRMQDLNTVVTNLPAGWSLTDAVSINDVALGVNQLSQIVGVGTINGAIRAFVLNP